MVLNQRRSRKKLIIGASLAVLVVAGVMFYMLDGVEKVRAVFQPKNQEQSITLTGKLVCLPRKDGGETATLSCALGMQTDAGKYYGLSSSQSAELSESAGSDKHIKLSGKLQSPPDDTYKMEAIVAVSSFDFTN
jgi:hypothetical protein